MLAGLLVTLAVAQEPPTAAPPVIWVALETDPKAACAAIGEEPDCGLRTRFVQTDKKTTANDSAAWQLLEARVLVQLHRELALGWNDPGSPASLLLRDSLGYDELPALAALFETGQPVDGLRHTRGSIASLPTTGSRKGSLAWMSGEACKRPEREWDGIFERASSDPRTCTDYPSTVLLQGAFGGRLAADGLDYPYAFGPAASSEPVPFVEQVLPLSRTARSVPSLAPFSGLEPGDPPDNPERWWACDQDGARAISVGDGDHTSTLYEGELECGRQIAGNLARVGFDRLGADLHRFGTPAYSAVHLRVLSALAGMSAPPGRYPGLTPVRLDDLSASTLGQLDPAELKQATIPPTVSTQVLDVDYQGIPDDVAWERLEDLAARQGTGGQALLNDNLPCLFGSLVRDGVTGPSLVQNPELPRPQRVEALRQAVDDWTETAAAPARRTELFGRFAGRALEVLVNAGLPDPDDDEERKAAGLNGPAPAGLQCWSTDDESAPPTRAPVLSEPTRATYERRLLIEALRFGTYRILNSAEPAAPGDQAKSIEKLWQGTLGTHGIVAAPMDPVRPFTVDPTSVCTTADGEESQGEAVNRKIDLDLYFTAPDTDTVDDDALWAARSQLPFLFVDDPVGGRFTGASTPTLERMGPLTGGQMLVRARWEVWSGWHLLWHVRDWEPPPDPGMQNAPNRHLRVRAAAFCGDTALAAEALVPAIVRLDLLPESAKGDLDRRMKTALGEWVRKRFAERLEEGEAALLVTTERGPPGGPPFGEVPFAVASRTEDGLRREVAGWTVAVPQDPEIEGGVVAPDGVYTEAEGRSEARWRSRTIVTARLDLGASAEFLFDESAEYQGLDAPVLDVHLGSNWWMGDQHRFAIEFGGGAVLRSWAPDPSLAASLARSIPLPTLGVPELVGGVKWAPRSAGLRRNKSARSTWGTDRPNGTRSLNQTQFGVRGGGTVLLESTVAYRLYVEPWLAWAVQSRNAPQADVSALDAGWLLGPTARFGAVGSGNSWNYLVGAGIRSWHRAFEGGGKKKKK